MFLDNKNKHRGFYNEKYNSRSYTIFSALTNKYLIGTLMLLIIIGTPILVNYIVTTSTSSTGYFYPNGIAESNDWLGFFANYAGGIVGGIVGGMLTLGGVYLTIREQRIEKQIDEYPKKKMACKNLEKALSVVNNEAIKILNNRSYDDYSSIITAANEVLSKRKDIIENAKEINGLVYVVAIDMIDDCDEIIREDIEKLDANLRNDMRIYLNSQKVLIDKEIYRYVERTETLVYRRL